MNGDDDGREGIVRGGKAVKRIRQRCGNLIVSFFFCFVIVGGGSCYYCCCATPREDIDQCN